MNAITLLAAAQLVSFAGLVYLYQQLQQTRARLADARHQYQPDHQAGYAHAEQHPAPQPAYEQAPVAHQPAAAPLPRDPATALTRLVEMGVDIPSIARRLRTSEAEVRLLMRRHGVAR